jgi:hypothetical protein
MRLGEDVDTSVPESSQRRDDRGLESDDSAKSFSAKGHMGEADLRGRVLGVFKCLDDSRLNETCRACLGL